jgi:hypothetical protein
VRQEQPVTDLTVGQALRRELGDLAFLGGEPVASVWRATSDRLAAGA